MRLAGSQNDTSCGIARALSTRIGTELRFVDTAGSAGAAGSVVRCDLGLGWTAAALHGWKPCRACQLELDPALALYLHSIKPF